jgi:L-threonylcarbamoyladenylate synthase
LDALQEQVEKGVKILRDGGVVAFPTDTVYGLGADVFNHEAVLRIYKIKNRPENMPFPLLVADMPQLTTIIAKPTSEIACFLAWRFWPGGLTLVLPKAASLPSYLAKGSTIGVRIPNHPVCLTLIKHLRKPIIGTSANLSGRASSLTAYEVKQQLGDKVDLIIDGGRCPGGVESTVVDVTSEAPVILRQGLISQQEIEKACKEYDERSTKYYSVSQNLL